MPIKKRPYASLKHWRNGHALSQDQAAMLLRVSQPYYSRVERQRQAPKPHLAQAISQQTGVPLESILGLR